MREMTNVEQQSDNAFVTRAYVFPEPGETLDALAARVLPEQDDARAVLLSWNPHLAVRAAMMDALGGMLPTDLVYVEPAGAP
jgi:hypothetical protein